MALFLSPLLLIFGALMGIAALEIDNPFSFEIPGVVYEEQATSPEPEVEEEVVEGLTGDENQESGSTSVDSEKEEPLQVASSTRVPEPEEVPAPRVQGSSVRAADLSSLSGMSSDDRYELLRLHNQARDAVDVPPLLWSSVLSESAQIWSTISAQNGCELTHSGTPYGEVVYYSKKTGDDTTPRNAGEVMREFLKEKVFYDDTRHTCDRGEVCGHYTQIVWEDTAEVGCGMAACVEPGMREEIWTCHYAPAGNVEGETPF